MDKTAQLKAKIERLRRKKTALLTQSRLLQDFVSLAKSSAKEQMLTAILQKTLELTAELSKAETGSLFLLDPDGVVRDCILTLLHSQPGIFHQGTVDRLPANFTMGSCCRTAAWPSSSGVCDKGVGSHGDQGMFATLCLGIINPQTGVLA
jgi:hypothetical protein